jgi:glycosyltransferase involved in cell wall biosynthesis
VDDTARVAEGRGATVIRHSTNLGYGEAIKTLFKAAKERNAEIMVTIDSDGQHDPDQIPIILEPILAGRADMVIGSRFLSRSDRERVPLYRTIGIKTITKLAQLVSYDEITDAQSGFRAYGSKAIQAIGLTEQGMAVSTEILIKAKDSGLRINEVPITISYDLEDTSTYDPVSHGFGIISSIIKFISVRHPLAFYGVPGLVFMAAAAVFVGLTVDLYATEGAFSINMSILAIGLGVFGLVLTATGVVLYVMANLRKSNPAP